MIDAMIDSTRRGDADVRSDRQPPLATARPVEEFSRGCLYLGVAMIAAFAVSVLSGWWIR